MIYLLIIFILERNITDGDIGKTIMENTKLNNEQKQVQTEVKIKTEVKETGIENTEKRNSEIYPKAEKFSSEYFLYTCEGRYKNRESRSEIGISLLLYQGDIDGDKEMASNDLNYREIATRLSKKGDIRFVKNKDQIIVDIIFNTSFEPELKLFWRQFMQYENLLRDMNNAEMENKPIKYPILAFTVVPDTYADECFLTFLNPTFWVLQPKDAETDECSMIRMLIPADNFNIEGVPEDAKLEDLEAEAARTYNTILTETR